MKKTYMTPQVEEIRFQTENMIAASLTTLPINSDTSITNEADGLSRGTLFDE